MKKILIVDYGSGNIRSAEQSLKKIIYEKQYNAKVEIIDSSEELKKGTHIILPGQGAFDSCIGGLKKIPGMIEELNNSVLKNKKPFLGICVGMQLLADFSYENGKHTGLGWIAGNITRLPQDDLKLPHMGWNEINIKNKKNKLTKNLKNENYYFVHSFYFKCNKNDSELATTNYGINFSSIIAKENIYGVQFHPEKSSTQGMKLLNNFINL